MIHPWEQDSVCISCGQDEWDHTGIGPYKQCPLPRYESQRLALPPAPEEGTIDMEQIAAAPSAPTPACMVSTWHVPKWVMPMAFKIGYGQGPKEVVNGINVDQDGDLVLYRKLCAEDYERYPELVGADEVWISVHLPIAD